jgi:hypothetical protein
VYSDVRVPSQIAALGPNNCVTQEAGMRVLEINCSTDRNGAKLMRLVGEATRSHRVSRAQQLSGTHCSRCLGALKATASWVDDK